MPSLKNINLKDVTLFLMSQSYLCQIKEMFNYIFFQTPFLFS